MTWGRGWNLHKNANSIFASSTPKFSAFILLSSCKNSWTQCSGVGRQDCKQNHFGPAHLHDELDVHISSVIRIENRPECRDICVS